MDTQKISFIICHHTGNLIHKCITSVLNSIAVDKEIIIVTSKYDFTLDLPKVNVQLIMPHLLDSPAVKRNFGVLFSKGDYLAFLDDDVTISPFWAYDMLQHFEDKNIGMCFNKILNMERRNEIDDAGTYLTPTGFLYDYGAWQKDSDIYNKSRFVLAGKSASCIIRKKLFLDINAFDSDFRMFGEETDLAWRVWLAGYKVLYCGDVKSYHAFRTSFKPKSQYYNYEYVHYDGCKNYITMLIKNLEKKNLYRILPLHIIGWLMMIIVYLLRGKYINAKYMIRGIWYVIKNRRYIWGKRLKVQKTRKISDAELFKYIYKKPTFQYLRRRSKEYITQGRS